MNILLLIISLLVSTPYTSNDESFIAVKEKIENSVIRISTQFTRTNEAGELYSDGGRGSGTFISINKHYYALTNAHVCLSRDLDNALNYLPIAKTFHYEIKSRNHHVSTLVDSKDLIYRLEEDWCLIPLPVTLDYPVLTEKDLTHDISKVAFYLTYNRKKEKTDNGYDKFTACAWGSFYYHNDNSCGHEPKAFEHGSMEYITSTAEKKQMPLSEGILYMFPVIPGDSGSPVFNRNNKLIGLIAASGTLQIDKLPEIKYGTMVPLTSLKAKVIRAND